MSFIKAIYFDHKSNLNYKEYFFFLIETIKSVNDSISMASTIL